MSTQPSLFGPEPDADPAPAAAARDEAIEAVTANADNAAHRALARVALDVAREARGRRGSSAHFTTDEIWAAWEARVPAEIRERLHEPRLLGGILTAMRNRHYVTSRGYVNSTRRERHAGPVSQWWPRPTVMSAAAAVNIIPEPVPYREVPDD